MNDLTRRKFAHARAREGIPVSLILERLCGHLNGAVELSPTQIRAAEILLKKSIPDLTAVEHSGSIENTVVTAEELRVRATQLGMDPEAIFADPGEPGPRPTAH